MAKKYECTDCGEEFEDEDSCPECGSDDVEAMGDSGDDDDAAG